MYVAASGCGSVLRITPDGRVTKLVQLQSPWSPTAVALFGRDVYLLEYLHTEVEDRRAWVPRVRKVSPDGKSVVIAKVEIVATTSVPPAWRERSRERVSS